MYSSAWGHSVWKLKDCSCFPTGENLGVNKKEIITAIQKELIFIKDNPNLAHDLRIESANRAMGLLNKLQSLIHDGQNP